MMPISEEHISPIIDDETSRIKRAYKKRDSAGKTRLYFWHAQDVIFTSYRFQAVAAKLLSNAGFTDISGKTILDVGCGTGKWLRTLREWGANPLLLHGIDLLPNRIEQAKEFDPEINYCLSNGWPIPFSSNSVDMVTAHMVFSSILLPEARLSLANEMSRVLQPDGLFLIYDFHISHPNNPDTTGITKREVRRLFHGSQVIRKTLTLAPPIQRLVTPFSPLFAHALEVLFPLLRTHSLYLIRKNSI